MVARENRLPLVLVTIGLLALAFAAAVSLRGPFFFMTCDPDDLGPSRLDQTILVYSADGQLLASVGEGSQRPVRLERFAEPLRRATIAIEDRRFYDHEGVDFRAVVRALFRDVRERAAVEGGSTITQQLARNLYLGREQTFGRKLREGCLAVALEREWSKDQILETYLNTAYYGNGAYGAEAAARTYFGVGAHRLTLEQAAMLAGIVVAPAHLDPFSAEDAVLERRRLVLQAMAETGDIGEQRAAAAAEQPLDLQPARPDQVQDRSVANLVLNELRESYGPGVIRQGGLKVHTTIHARLQRAARNAIRSSLDEQGDPAAAVVAIDPANGAIRAAASVAPGGTQFLNLAAFGRRQSGSAFKTFVLAEAIRRQVDPAATTYLSAPFEGPPTGEEPWHVKTYDETYTGVTPIAASTLRSDNTVYARMTLDLGPQRVARLAQAMGIESDLPEVPSLGLGTASVTPLELAAAYATLARGGVRAKPFLIRKVVHPDGREDQDGVWGPRDEERVLPEAAAFEVTRVLEQNIQAGTGTRAQLGRPAAGKTGTTDDHADAWFAGYTPDLVAVVWVGHAQGRVPMLDVHGIAVAGGTFPAAIWQAFMSAALDGSEPQPWPQPGEAMQWQRFCGRFQYAATYRDARPEGVCDEPQTETETETEEQTTQEEEQPPPPPPTQTEEEEQPQPPPPGDDLVGARGRVTQDVVNEAGTGEVEVRGGRWPARSETGEPLPVGTRIEVVRVDGELVWVQPR